MSTDKIPPHSEEMERCLLSSAMYAPRNVLPMMTMLGVVPAAFYIQAHQTLFMMLRAMSDKNQPIDLMTVVEYGQSSGVLAAIGGYTFVERVFEACQVAAHAQYYAEKVMELYARRRVINAARATVESAYSDADRPASDLVAELNTNLAAAVKVSAKDIPLHELATTMIDEWQTGAQRTKYLQWPLPVMANFIGELSDEYIVLAAQPSVGKTALALQFSVFNASSGHRIAYASLESARAKLAARLIALMGEVKTLSLRRRTYALPQDYDRARRAAARLKELPLSIYPGSMTLSQLRAWAYREKANGAEGLVIDNMKHIRTEKQF